MRTRAEPGGTVPSELPLAMDEKRFSNPLAGSPDSPRSDGAVSDGEDLDETVDVAGFRVSLELREDRPDRVQGTMEVSDMNIQRGE